MTCPEPDLTTGTTTTTITTANANATIEEPNAWS